MSVFQKLVLVMGVILLLLLGAVFLGTLSSRDRGTSTPPPQEATAIPPQALAPGSTPLAANPNADVRFIVSGPQSLQMGQAAQHFTLSLVAKQPLGALSFVLSTGAPNLQLVDIDNETPGIQVALGALPAGAEVVRSEVDANGVWYYELRNLASSGVYTQNLALLLLAGQEAGMAGIVVEAASAQAPGGAALTLDPGPALMVLVQGAGAVPAPPVPVPMPVTPPDPAFERYPGEIAPGIYYRIQRGQNLFRLGQTFGVTSEAIAQANGITDVRRIPTGMLLYIPATAPVGQSAYLVAPGETLYGIAGTFGMTVEQLAALNTIAPPYQLPAGIYLILRP